MTLKEFLAAKGLNQKILCEATGINSGRMSRHAKHWRILPDRDIALVAQFLEVPIQEIRDDNIKDIEPSKNYGTLIESMRKEILGLRRLLNSSIEECRLIEIQRQSYKSRYEIATELYELLKVKLEVLEKFDSR